MKKEQTSENNFSNIQLHFQLDLHIYYTSIFVEKVKALFVLQFILLIGQTFMQIQI